MQVSKDCMELLNNFNIPRLKSNFLIADLKNIQYGIIDETSNSFLNYDNYWHKPLSQDMLDLVEEWKNKIFSEDLFLLLNNNLKQIVKNDTITYSAQIIFPLFINEKLDGFAIFFRINGDYVISSSKAPKTIRNFIQKELNKKEKGDNHE